MALTPGQIEQEKKEDGLPEKAKDFSFGKEREKAPEIGAELREKDEIKKEEEKKPAIKEKESAIQPIITSSLSVPLKKTVLEREIETVLSQDLDQVYAEMNPEQKIIFKAEGEKAAHKIAVLIKSVKVKTKQILDLIKHWLKFIPSVNKYFLEQEAKIKTDRILKIKIKE
jgi:hypothetical protein